MSASSSRVCFQNTFQSWKKYRESQSAITRVVLENLTMKLYSWEKNVAVSNQMCQNLRYRYGLAIFHMISTSIDFSVFIPLLRSQMLFQGYRDILIIV